MKELADIALLVAALAGLCALVLAGICLLLVVQFLLRLLNTPMTWIQTAPTSNSEDTDYKDHRCETKPIKTNQSKKEPIPAPAPAPAPTPAPAPAPAHLCEHCGAPLTEEIVRGLAADEGSFNVYVCAQCREETAIPIAEN